VAAEVLPVLGGQRDGRRYVMEMGRGIKESYEARRCYELDWSAGLRLHIEVWDARDNLRMLSVEGPLGVCRHQEVPGTVALCVYNKDGAREVVGPAFSVASRGEYLESIQDYFIYGVCVDPPTLRVVVRDSRSGRQASIMEETFLLHDEIPPDGRLQLEAESECVILNPFKDTFDKASATLTLNLELGQEGVPELEKLYRMKGGLADHDDGDHFAVHIVFKGFPDHNNLGLQILSKLHLFDRIP
jgi:hypothetical protein